MEANNGVLVDPLVLLATGLVLELVAVLVSVLPAHPPAPVAPLALVLAGLLLATVGAVGIARES